LEQVDAIVVGAGVVGLAIGRALSQTLKSVLILDKNVSFGEETSSRNSEVIHAGLYYPTGSLKAQLCVRGKHLLYKYCTERSVSHQRIGKLIVATNESELTDLKGLKQQASINGVDDLVWLDKVKVNAQYPLIQAVAGLYSPSTGIIDVHDLMLALLGDVETNNGMFVGRSKVVSISRENNGFNVIIDSQGELLEVKSQYVVNASGLHSTAVANSIENFPTEHIPLLYYCRGHYFSYQGKSPFKELVYPVPSAHGLGIHASIDMGGQLKFGPDTQYIDGIDYSVDPQLKEKFAMAIKRYFPSLDKDRLQPAYSGIRPKLQAENEGFKDFVIQGKEIHGFDGLVNLYGIDSPGLTSSLAIGEYVRERLLPSD